MRIDNTGDERWAVGDETHDDARDTASMGEDIYELWRNRYNMEWCGRERDAYQERASRIAWMVGFETLTDRIQS